MRQKSDINVFYEGDCDFCCENRNYDVRLCVGRRIRQRVAWWKSDDSVDLPCQKLKENGARREK
jgi:hypothetical protein